MDNEIMKILKMVEEGKISSDKAEELISALKNNSLEVYNSKNEDLDYINKMLKIKVISKDGDNVNVKLPIKFIKAVLKTAGKIPIPNNVKGMENIDLNVISDAIGSELTGNIIDVTSKDGDIVNICIE